MTVNIAQSTSFVAVFKAFLASDHATEATGKTIAITISKAGGAFGNPNAGATNATEISSGWYKVTLDTTDTATLGIIAIRGAVATIDDVGIWYNVVSATTGGATNLDATVSSRASQTTLDTLDDFVDTEVAAILAAVDTEVGAIKTKTDFLPSATAGATGGLFIAGTNAATTVTTSFTTTFTGNLTGNVGGTINGLTATALKDFFDTDSTTTYASAVAGSVVKEIADNSGGAALTVQDIVDGVWDEDATGHQTTGTFGQAIGDPGADTDTIWALVNTNLNATVSSRATQTSVDTIDDILDTEFPALVTAVADLPTNAELATALDTADDAVLTAINDLPTNAELATALGTADDAVLVAIAALTIPTANQNADALLDRADAIETGLTPRQAMRISAAADGGKLSGGATATNTIRNAVADDKDRIIATVDANGNRTAITYDLT